MSASPKLKLALFWLLLLAIVAGTCEGMARLTLRLSLPGWEKTRQLMAGEAVPDPRYQMSISQAYLLYIPSPNYADAAGVQHNSQGYRGKAVQLRRTPGVVRVLCLGGSTTYGWGTPRAEDAYPAWLERILAQDLPPGVTGVEVINGGIPFGTTAENLTHYHFKFHYYRPDIVVVNPGGNDAESMVNYDYYHPDYSHYRRALQLPPPLPPLGRLLIKSRFVAILLIPLVHGETPASDAFVKKDRLPPLAQWYPPPPGETREERARNIPDDEIAFKHNLESLLGEIESDGARVLLVPFRFVDNQAYRPDKGGPEAVAREEKLLWEIAAKRKLPIAPFPASVISPGNWTDTCHYNAEGNREKAAHVAPYVREILAQLSPAAGAAPLP